MRIAAVGGGPACLYAALLLRKADPTHEVVVHERLPPDETFGWGVVFSDATLAALREADLPSYTAITEAFVRWSAIDVRYRGRTVRADGHVFAAIARKHLLAILQRRCRELGVQLVFEHEVADLEAFAGADLILAGDGIHSSVREARPDRFGTRLDERHSRYIWYGTPLTLDAFTFSFRSSPHGLFQAHAYPFDGTTSTFIVETTDAAWRAAGLDAMDEAESIAFCQELFADDLGGAPLLSNQSRWARFVTVRNRSWVDGNVVLLGDAAHTAHFSIGSGTKLAMEDAIALATAVAERPADLPAALGAYEQERRPVVERLQAAAQDSLHYFETVERFTHLEALPFAFALLTRSGRITYDSLRLRDPGFVASVDARFAGDERLWAAPPPALTAARVGGLELDSRVVAAPVATAAARDGLAGAEHAAELAEWARTGAGLVLVGPIAVSPGGRITPDDAGLYAPEHALAWAQAVAAAKAEASRAGVRMGALLGHAGRRGATQPRHQGVDLPLAAGGWPLLAASAVPWTPGHPTPAALSRADMDAVRDAFAKAARMAVEAGFDLLQIDLADGYLLAGFLSPLTNARDDEWGGPLERRMAFPLEVVAAVRDAWPADRPVAARITVDDRAPGGTTMGDAIVVARALDGAGVDLVEVRAGQTTPGGGADYGPGFLVAYADELRNTARVPVLVGGALRTLGDVNTVLAAARADLCILDPRPSRP